MVPEFPHLYCTNKKQLRSIQDSRFHFLGSWFYFVLCWVLGFFFVCSFLQFVVFKLGVYNKSNVFKSYILMVFKIRTVNTYQKIQFFLSKNSSLISIMMWSTSQNPHKLIFLADQITLITFWSFQVFSKLSITYWVQQVWSTFSKEIPESRPLYNTHLVTEIHQWRSVLELH